MGFTALKEVCKCSRECFHIPCNAIMSYQQLCYRSLWEERERVNQTTKCRLISAQGTWEWFLRCLLKVGHTEQTTSMYIYTSYPEKNALLTAMPSYTANISSLCSWTAVLGTQSTALFTWENGRDCSISVQTDRSVDRHQYHHQEWIYAQSSFPGCMDKQRTDIFWASMQSKPLWTKQIKGGVWTWPGMWMFVGTALHQGCPAEADRAGLWNKEQRNSTSCARWCHAWCSFQLFPLTYKYYLELI